LKLKVVRKIDFVREPRGTVVPVQVVGTTRALPSLPHCGTTQLMLGAVCEIYAPSPTWHADEKGLAQLACVGPSHRKFMMSSR
jgi:hypothetical protein